MWQQLVSQVGVIWVISVLILTISVAAIVVLLMWLLRGLAQSMNSRLKGLRLDIESLPSCRIENMKQTQIIISDRGGPEMKLALEQMADDSKAQFQGLWVPDPIDRLSWEVMLNRQNAWLLQPSTTTLPLLAGVLVSFLALVLAIAISAESITNDWMRFLALLPLLIGGLGMVFLMQSKARYQMDIKEYWHGLIIQLQRKLPVFNQAAETSSLLTAFVHYDQQMTEAAHQLTEQVQVLASHQLADSITGAVKYVMAASVAPPIQKSTDALNLLAQQLEKKMVSGENQLIRLYTELENRQQQQAELWIKRYQEMAQTLAVQQKHSLQQIASGSQSAWQDLHQQLNSLLQEISQGQARLQQTLQQGQETLQKDLLADQQLSLEAIRDESHSVVTQMRDQYSATVQEQSSRQVSALDDIQKQVLESVNLVAATIGQTAGILQTSQQQALQGLCDSHAALLGSIDQHQQAALLAMQDHQQLSLTEIREENKTVVTQMRDQFASAVTEQSAQQTTALSQIQEQVLRSVRLVTAAVEQTTGTLQSSQLQAMQVFGDNQAKLLESVGQNQQATLQALTVQQRTALDGFLSQQIEALAEIKGHQQETLSRLTEQLQQGLRQIDDGQQSALGTFRQTQQEAISTLAKQQSEGVHDLLEQFSGQVADILSVHLGPVSTRLADSAQALISAQSYARDVQATLALQKEQARVLETSIRDVLAQMVETRQNMTGDLGSLEKSTRVMSESAASMSAIYAGSQTGLSDSITHMSSEMNALSDALREVLKGSAEQTRLLQSQANETYEINQSHLDAVRGQIDILTNDLSTRIDQLMIGFSQLTEDLIKNVQHTIDNQNDALGSGLKALTGVMADEARSMSLYAQQINMDINELNGTLGQAVGDFSKGINSELSHVLQQFDQETADILRRLSVAAAELGDAVEILPDMIRVRGAQGAADPAVPARPGSDRK